MLDVTLIYAFTCKLMTAWAHIRDDKRKMSCDSPKKRHQSHPSNKKFTEEKKTLQGKPIQGGEHSFITTKVFREMACSKNFLFFTSKN